MRNSKHAEIVETADRLFYERGYEHTSFADIGEAVGISRGNFYYHFKTKDELLDAVITRRLAARGTMLECWENACSDPKERIRSFIELLIVNQAQIMEHGCPIGSLCAELGKLNHTRLASANRLFLLFRTWLGVQFTALGRVDDADALAMHVLMLSQGVAVLANVYQDKAFVRREVDMACDWLDRELGAR